jgi:AcrR family transcriptional regulator
MRAILDAAIDVLGERPDASIDEVARSAGVSRQTVYAHYGSRAALVRAVQERALAEAVATIDAAALDEGSAAEALDRLVGAGWQTLVRYPVLIKLRAPMSAEEEQELQQPVLDRLERLVRRGQRSGDFDRRLPVAWLLAAFLALSHAAADEVAAGRVGAGDAAVALRRSVAGAFGVASE